jgi:5'-deoxynucleotidase
LDEKIQRERERKGENPMHTTFLAMMFRMRYIGRWSLMHNTQEENLSQHTAECAFLVHFLAHVGNTYCGKAYDPDKLCAHALYHDAPEILTGDLPTPIKYFSDDMRDTYRQIEAAAAEKLLGHLPAQLREVYRPYLSHEGLSAEETRLLKIADKLCAHIKCLVEMKAGNEEFSTALAATRADLERLPSEELDYFLENCLHAFTMSLDELGGVL